MGSNVLFKQTVFIFLDQIYLIRDFPVQNRKNKQCCRIQDTQISRLDAKRTILIFGTNWPKNGVFSARKKRKEKKFTIKLKVFELV